MSLNTPAAFERLFASAAPVAAAHHEPAFSLLSLFGPRAENQDRAFVGWLGPRRGRRPMMIACVVDGMGGMQAGEAAAVLAAARFMAAAAIAPDADSALAQGLARANHAVFKRYAGEGGATLTAVALTPERCASVHVGDSRLYRLARVRLEQRTTDDTMAGLLGLADADSGGLMQFVGVGPSMLCQHRAVTISGSSRLLLTTDGLHALGKPILHGLAAADWQDSRLWDAVGLCALTDNASGVVLRVDAAREELERLAPGDLKLFCNGQAASFTESRGD